MVNTIKHDIEIDFNPDVRAKFLKLYDIMASSHNAYHTHSHIINK